jgi:hypothetical protein
LAVALAQLSALQEPRHVWQWLCLSAQPREQHDLRQLLPLLSHPPQSEVRLWGPLLPRRVQQTSLSWQEGNQGAQLHPENIRRLSMVSQNRMGIIMISILFMSYFHQNIVLIIIVIIPVINTNCDQSSQQ